MAIERLLADFGKALDRLENAYTRAIEYKETNYNEFFRDSSIQRFEICVELMWKSVKKFLEEFEGITCRSPKGCTRELLSVGLISENDSIEPRRMIDNRSITVHTYHQEIAEQIFGNIGSYRGLMRKILSIIKGSGSSE